MQYFHPRQPSARQASYFQRERSELLSHVFIIVDKTGAFPLQSWSTAKLLRKGSGQAVGTYQSQGHISLPLPPF